jgi:hypothetical protein
MDQTAPQPQIDLPTVAAMAAVVFLGSTLLHEAGGHGGACVALGGRVDALGAFYLDCASDDFAVWSGRALAAAGSTMNLLAALAAWVILRGAKAEPWRLFWWLVFVINGLVWAGYFLFSGVFGIGDWGEGGALNNVTNSSPWRIALAVFGALTYLIVAYEAARQMGMLLGGTIARRKVARAIAWTAYFTGGIVSVLIGLMNPVGIFIVIASAAASSLGGTSGLLWLTYLMPRSEIEGTLRVPRSWGWIVVALATTAAYAWLLGPSLVFTHSAG